MNGAENSSAKDKSITLVQYIFLAIGSSFIFALLCWAIWYSHQSANVATQAKERKLEKWKHKIDTGACREVDFIINQHGEVMNTVYQCGNRAYVGPYFKNMPFDTILLSP